LNSRNGENPFIISKYGEPEIVMACESNLKLLFVSLKQLRKIKSNRAPNVSDPFHKTLNKPALEKIGESVRLQKLKVSSTLEIPNLSDDEEFWSASESESEELFYKREFPYNLQFHRTTELLCKGEPFDIIIAWESLSDQEIDEVDRLLAKGGILVTTFDSDRREDIIKTRFKLEEKIWRRRGKVSAIYSKN
jgi:hypothetical protein